MKSLIIRNPEQKPQREGERGIALVTTLLLLMLITGMTVAMAVSVNSDMMINGYYRNFRGAFYAADSGLNIARQDLYNQIAAAVPATVAAGTQPIATSTPATVQSYINSTYGSSYKYVSGSGQAANSWPEKYKITSSSLSLASCQVIGGGGTCTAPTGTPTGYRYVYNYGLTGVGQSQGSEEVSLTDSGSLTVTATVASSGTDTSFAAWGMFIDKYDICNGGSLVAGTISGPVFTNGAWTFGEGGAYTFTDSVGMASSKFGYQYNSGTCHQSSSTSDSNGSGSSKKTIAPTYAVTPKIGQSKVALPDNDYSQQGAVLDGKGTGAAAPTNADRAAVLRNVSKTKYATTGQTSGVWLPYAVDPSSGVATFTGGGILVEGDAAVTLSTSGTTAQVYTIKQGSTTTTVTVNSGTNTTTVASGSTSLTINGVPRQLDPVAGTSMGNATMLYVDGNITALTGPGQGVAGIQDGTALTITAFNNITITGDILYKTQPVTLTQNQIANTPADTLISGNDNGQVLGIFTSKGDVQLADAQGDSNLKIDASIATISQTGTGGIVNTGNSINTLTIVGGRIQNQIKNINATTRNVLFDRRFSSGFGPPWFPSTSIIDTSVTTSTLDHVFQRTGWLNQTSYK